MDRGMNASGSNAMKTHGFLTIGPSTAIWRIGTIMLALMICSAPFASAQGILKKLEDRIKSKLPPAPRPAGAEPGYLGVMADQGDGGVKVGDVAKGSPAQLAGLRPGDLIIGVGEQTVATVDDMASALEGAAVGTRFGFRIRRGEEEEVIHVTLGRKGQPPRSIVSPPAAGSPDVAPPPIVSGPPRAPASLGVSLMPVTPELRARHSIPVPRGAVIEKIREGSAADQAGLPLYAVIIAAEGKQIDSPETLIELIKSKRPGDPLLLTYYQGAEKLRKNVRLGTAASAPTPADPTAGDEEVIVPEEAIAGITPADDGGEVARLRREVADLRAELEALRKELAAIREALSGEKAPAPADEKSSGDSEEEPPQLRRPKTPGEAAKEADA